MGFINGENVLGFEPYKVDGKVSPPTAADSMKAYKVKNSLLDKKSYLQFEYPNEVDIGGPATRLRLPFYEDPEIRESKSSRYASYKVMSRASELFSYLGSDARQFSLSFKITLPHIANMFNTNLASQGPSTGSKKEEMDKFFANSGFAADTNETIRPRAGDYRNAYTPDGHDPTIDQARINELGYPFTHTGYKRWQNLTGLNDNTRGDAVKDIVTYWLDVIRSSTYNNVQNPLFGPPIVRLTHGLMHRGIPCIVTNYSFTYDPNTGYDKDTLLPRVIKVDMELKEVRTGDFGTFDPSPLQAETEAGDNLAGWEAVIQSNPNQIGGTLDSLQRIGL